MDTLGNLLFPPQNINADDQIIRRSSKSDMIRPPVPGYPDLAVNLMATAWNENISLRNATNLGSAIKASRQWSKSILI